MHVVATENQLGLRPLWLPMPTYATHLCSKFGNPPDQRPEQEKCGEVVGMESAAVATKWQQWTAVMS
jgi:hypothetical protein